jgi:hypothetical protein
MINHLDAMTRYADNRAFTARADGHTCRTAFLSAFSLSPRDCAARLWKPPVRISYR